MYVQQFVQEGRQRNRAVLPLLWRLSSEQLHSHWAAGKVDLGGSGEEAGRRGGRGRGQERREGGEWRKEEGGGRGKGRKNKG